jgi:4-amino-4-deoxy-L-arabinose transferase-like glycosyltransferase
MEAPDEANHLWVVRFLSEHLHVPSASEVYAAGSAAVYGSLPPFGYLPNVIVASFFRGSHFVLASRFGSLLAGWPTVAVAYALGKQIFSSKSLVIALPLLVVLHPQLIFTNSYTNTDSLVTTLCSTCLYLTVQSINKGATLPKTALLGFLMGWAALSKTNSLALLPAILFGLWCACCLNRASMKWLSAITLTFLGTLGTMCLWWYARNYYEFAGDCLGSRTMMQIWEATLPHINGITIKPWPQLASLSWWRFVFFDYWGLFGFMTRYLWRPLYFIFLSLCTIATLGWISSSKISSMQEPDCERNKSDLSENTQQPPNGLDNNSMCYRLLPNERVQAIWQVFALCLVLNMAAVVYVTIAGVSGPHGRYLFPSELPLFALILAGFAKFGPRRERVLTIALASTCLVSTVSGWIMFYAGHSWTK